MDDNHTHPDSQMGQVLEGEASQALLDKHRRSTSREEQDRNWERIGLYLANPGTVADPRISEMQAAARAQGKRLEFDIEPLELPELRVISNTVSMEPSLAHEGLDVIMTGATQINIEYSDGKGFGPLPITAVEPFDGGSGATITLGNVLAGETPQGSRHLRGVIAENKELRERLKKQAMTIHGKEQALGESNDEVARLTELLVRLRAGELNATGEADVNKPDEALAKLRTKLDEAYPDPQPFVTTGERWRVGTKVALNVYQGDTPMAQFHDSEDARLVVRAVNELLERLSVAQTPSYRVAIELHPEHPDLQPEVVWGPYETLEGARATMTRTHTALNDADDPWVWMTGEGTDTMVHKNQVRRVSIIIKGEE